MTRPYPWKCRRCRKQAVHPRVADYSTEIEHDGRIYPVTVPDLPMLECSECHARTLPDASFEQVMGAFRQEAGLLTPSQIRDRRKQLGLTQEQLAGHLRVAEETVCRWEKGAQIQQRSMDLLLRLFFDLPEVRRYFGIKPDAKSAAVSVGRS
jgi:putative zinc finger/helix-turn-helix YgiT family protein